LHQTQNIKGKQKNKKTKNNNSFHSKILKNQTLRKKQKQKNKNKNKTKENKRTL